MQNEAHPIVAILLSRSIAAAALTERDQTRPLADFECAHGRLPHDLYLGCSCWLTPDAAKPALTTGSRSE